MDYSIQSTNTNSAVTNHLSLDVLINTFLERKDLKKASEKSYRAAFDQFMKYLSCNSITTPTEKNIKEFKEYLMNRNLSAFTIISYLGSIKSLFSFLARRHLYLDIANDIRLPKKPREFMRDALTKEQAQQLLKSSLGDEIIFKRNYAILNILLRCGLRSIELIRADIGDVRKCNGTPVLWVHGKGRDEKDEYVVLTQEALKTITTYLSARGVTNENEPLFASHGPRNSNGRLSTRTIRRMVKEQLKTIGLNEKALTCHSLRHTFATLAIANNASLLAVQKAMRHADINTTTIYTHMADRLHNGAEHFIDI